MDLQPKAEPKAEPESPPSFGSSNHGNLNNMSIGDLVSALRTAFLTEDFDRVEEVLVSRDERLNVDIEMERLARFHAEEELRKREELCERGKRAQERYEMLLKEVKKSGLADTDNITELRKKISELECEVCEMRKLKEKLVDDSNVIAELRIRVRVLEDDKNALAALVVKNGELEEEVKKNLTTIDHLRNENSKFVDEKHRIERLFKSLKRKYGETYEGVGRLKDDTKILRNVDASGGGKTEGDPGVTAVEDKDEEDVHDYEIGNDIVKPASLQRNEDSSHSVEVAGTFHNKEILNDLSVDMSSKGKEIAEGSSRSSASTTGVSGGADQQQQQQQQLPLSRYEAQKRRDWNTFRKYLRNQTPPVALSQCNSNHVLEFLRYFDRFGKTKVHLQGCQFFGQTEPPGTCTCPLRQAWGSLDALIGRLRAAYEDNEGLSETNPFASGSIRVYLRKVRDSQAKARGIPYKKKKKKSNTIKHNGGTSNLPLHISLGQAEKLMALLSHQAKGARISRCIIRSKTNKAISDKGGSVAGRLELEKDDNDDAGCTSRRFDGKKVVSGVNMKN